MRDIAIIDEHPLVRFALKIFLEKQGYIVKADMSIDPDAFSILKELRPELLIIGLESSEIQMVDLINRVNPYGRIIILSARDDETFIKLCANKGAASVVSKKKNLEEIGDAVRAVLKGYSFLPLRKNNR